MVLSLTSIDNHSVYNSNVLFFIWKLQKTEIKNPTPRPPGARPKHGFMLSNIYPLLGTIWWNLMVRENGQFESNDGYQKL